MAYKYITDLWLRSITRIYYFHVINYSCVKIGKNTFVSHKASVKTASPYTNPKGGYIEIGAECKIMEYANLFAGKGFIKIGDRCSVQPFSILDGYGGIEIGNDVRIANNVSIIAAEHNFQNAEQPIAEQGMNSEGIKIRDDVWIGAGTRILDGVIVGKGSVIGAGSVVTKNVDPYSVVVGVPAKVIKIRD